MCICCSNLVLKNVHRKFYFDKNSLNWEFVNKQDLQEFDAYGGDGSHGTP
jgi:hypothetical protein